MAIYNHGSFIVTGAALASLKQTTKQLIDGQVPLQTPEYQVYPKPLKDIYDHADRRLVKIYTETRNPS